MAKLLNLDELSANTDLVVKFGGNEYPIEPLSVGGFIEMNRRAQALEASGEEMDLATQVEVLVDTIRQSIPSCPVEVLKSMKINQLYAIMNFVHEQASEGAEEDSEGKK